MINAPEPHSEAPLFLGAFKHMSHRANNEIGLKANIAWNTIGSIFYQGCLWLMTVLVVRLSSDYQNSGSLAFAMSIGNIYTALGTYTVRTFQVSDVKNTYSASNYIGLRVITVLGALLGCGAYGLAVSPSLTTRAAVITFLLFKADESFVNVLYGCDQKGMRLDYVGKSQIIRGVLVVSLFVVGMEATHNLALSIILVAIGCFLVTLLYDLRKTNGLTDSLKPDISKEKALYLLRKLFPTVLGNFLAGLVTSAARQYFAIAFGEEALGIYASVATPCVIVQVLAQNLYTPMLGPIATLRANGDNRAARRKSIELLLTVIGVALGLSIPLILFSGAILDSLYGDTILPYLDVLPLALLVTTGVASIYVVTDLLIVYDKLRKTLTVNVIAFVVMVSLLVPLTSLCYMNGLNLTLLIAYISGMLYGLWILLRTS